jgi:hypothetical protein
MMAEIVPFFATEEEHKTVDTLPTETTPVKDLINAIPKFKDVVRGNLLVQWAVVPNYRREDLLVYHIYKIDRKKIFDIAEAALLTTTGSDAKAVIANEANAALEESPWWPDFESTLKQALVDHFKEIAGECGYYREVDSWAVSIPAYSPMWPESFIEGFADKLSAKVEG